MAAALDHPFICKVYEIGEEEGKSYISMECIRGRTLREQMNESNLPLSEALDIALEIGEALAEAHQRGIMHRDLKPANIMITPQGHVKVMDFGLAKRVTSNPGPGHPDGDLRWLDPPRDGDRNPGLHVSGAGAGRKAGYPL